MKKAIGGAAFVLIVFIVFELWISKYGLMTTQYELTSEKLLDSVRIVQLTDLHDSVFGKDNIRLVEKVRKQKPDLILITGDLLNAKKEEIQREASLISQLSELAPVYFSYGNHEVEYEEKYGIDVEEMFRSAGAVVLDKSWLNVDINGQALRIGGLYGYAVPESIVKMNGGDLTETAFLSEFQNTERYTVLLCHMPLCWIQNNGISEWKIDAVFSGHVHGGQIRIPFIGGLYAPDQGWFPGREAGLYYSDDGKRTLILSRGLGSTEWIPRFHNIPEITVVDLAHKTSGE